MSDAVKLESAIREALARVQRNGILCTHADLAEQQLQGAVRVVIHYLAKDCPELFATAETTNEHQAAVK